MIAPSMIGGAALVARFDALPRALRAALVNEADRLGRVLRDRIARPAAGEAISLAVASTADAVTVTMAAPLGHAARPQRATRPTTGRALVAPRHARSHHLRRAAAPPTELTGLHAAFVAMGPEIRAGLEMAVRRALVR